MFTPDEMNFRAKALNLKSGADEVDGPTYRELALAWRLLALQSVFVDAMLAAESVGRQDGRGPRTAPDRRI